MANGLNQRHRKEMSANYGNRRGFSNGVLSEKAVRSPLPLPLPARGGRRGLIASQSSLVVALSVIGAGAAGSIVALNAPAAAGVIGVLVFVVLALTSAALPRLGLPIFALAISVWYFVEQILKYRLGLQDQVISYLSRWQAVYLIAVALFGLRRIGSRFRWTFLDLSILLFVAFTVVYLPSAPTALIALYGFSTLAQFAVAYLAGRSSPEALNSLASGLIVIGVPLAAFGVLQPILLGDRFFQDVAGYVSPLYYQATGSGFPRAPSLMGHPGYFGSFMMIVLCLAVAKALGGERQLVPRVLNYAAVVLCMAGLIASFHRTSWAAALVGVLFIVILSTLRSARSLPFIAGLVAALVVWGGLLNAGAAVNNVLNLQDVSAQSHIDLLPQYAAFVVDHPLGVGIGRAGQVAVAFDIVDRADARAGVEGGYSQIAYQLGVLGLVLFVLVLTVGLAISVKKASGKCNESNWIAIGLAGAALGIIVFNLTLPFFTFNPALMCFWLLVGAMSTRVQTSRPEFSRVMNNDHRVESSNHASPPSTT